METFQGFPIRKKSAAPRSSCTRTAWVTSLLKSFGGFPSVSKTVYHAGCRDETTDDWDWWLDVWTVPSGDDSMGGLLWPIDETWWNHWDCWGWMGDWITFDDRIPMKKCCFDQAAGARRLWHEGHAFGARSMASPRHDFFWDHPTNPWRAARMAPTGWKRGELTTICCGQNHLEIESDK